MYRIIEFLFKFRANWGANFDQTQLLAKEEACSFNRRAVAAADSLCF